MSHHILVVEGNHEQLVSVSPAGEITGAAEDYAACLQAIDPELSFSVTRPHFEHDPADAPDWERISAVVFTGAGVAWAGDAAEARPARDVMETAFSRQLPVFGSCYGLHLGVAVLGGQLTANPAGPEIAFARNIHLTDAGLSHPLYSGKPVQFDALCMHRDDVLSLSSSLQILSGNEHCAIQAVASTTSTEQFWGVQYHPELSFRHIASYIRRADVAAFSDMSMLQNSLSAHEVISDLLQLDEDADIPALHQKYSLGDDILSRRIHQTELHNWLDLIKS